MNKQVYIENDLYKEIIEYTIISCVDIIVINNEKQILLCLRNNKPLKGVYYIPGGRRYKNEAILDSIKRKVKEELGIDINESKLIFLGVYDDIFNESIFENIGTHCSQITYIYNLDKNEEENLKLDTQHNDYKFFNIDDKNIHEMVKIRINDIKTFKLI